MASSSCSFAAVALARSLFRKGANFTAAMAFEIASTNLVLELGVILLLLMGWQFTLAEFIGGPIIIIAVAVMFRIVLRKKLIDAAAEQADRGVAGSMEGHAGMDMSIQKEGGFWARLISADGATSVAHVFVMEWAAIWKDLVAVVSFVCSIGNVPLAVVLWSGGISFGGVIAFIFADLLILPVLNIYQKYYGWKMTGVLVGVFYLAMVIAGYLVELIFTPPASPPTNPRHTCPTKASAGTTPPGSTSPSSPSPHSWSGDSSAPAEPACSP